MAFNLLVACSASVGCFVPRKIRQCVARVLRDLPRLAAGPDPRHPPPLEVRAAPGVQSRISTAIVAEGLRATPIVDILWKKLIRWCPLAATFSWNKSATDAEATLRALPERLRLGVVRAWASAWPTTARLHASHVRGRPWGCEGGRDSLDHFIECNAVLGPFASGVLAGAFVCPCGLLGPFCWRRCCDPSCVDRRLRAPLAKSRFYSYRSARCGGVELALRLSSSHCLA